MIIFIGAVLIIYRTLKYFLFVSITTFSVYTSASDKSIHIATENFPPFSSQYLPYNGFLIKIVTEAFSIQGVQVVYKFERPEQSFSLAKDGIVAGTVPWTYKPERKKHFYYSDPIVPSDDRHFYFLKSQPLSWKSGVYNLESLKDVTLGGVSSYSHGTRIENDEKIGKLKIIRAQNMHENLVNLFSGKVDVAICHVTVCNNLLKNDFANKQHLIEHIAINNNQEHYHLLLSRKNDENIKLIDIFNHGLRKIKANGTFKKIISEYLEQ